MKFTFGPIHRFSIWLYVPGIPMIIFSMLDYFLAWNTFENTFRIQFFIVGMIMVLMASVLNLSHYVFGMLKKELGKFKNQQD